MSSFPRALCPSPGFVDLSAIPTAAATARARVLCVGLASHPRPRSAPLPRVSADTTVTANHRCDDDEPTGISTGAAVGITLVSMLLICVFGVLFIMFKYDLVVKPPMRTPGARSGPGGPAGGGSDPNAWMMQNTAYAKPIQPAGDGSFTFTRTSATASVEGTLALSGPGGGGGAPAPASPTYAKVPQAAYSPRLAGLDDSELSEPKSPGAQSAQSFTSFSDEEAGGYLQVQPDQPDDEDDVEL